MHMWFVSHCGVKISEAGVLCPRPPDSMLSGSVSTLGFWPTGLAGGS